MILLWAFGLFLGSIIIMALLSGAVRLLLRWLDRVPLADVDWKDRPRDRRRGF